MVALGLITGHARVGALTALLLATLVLGLRRSRGELLLLFCLAWLRGASVHVLGEPTFPRSSKHLVVEVRGASWPGGRCRVDIAVPRQREALTLELEEGDCEWVQGDHLLVESSGSPVSRDLAGGWRLRRTRALLRRPGEDGIRRAMLGGLVRVRARAWSRTRGDPEAAFSAAVALGHRHVLAPGLRQKLRVAGLGHLLAVSGLHVGLLAWLVQLLARSLLGGTIGALRLATAMSALPVLAFVFASGASDSALRAGLMALAFASAGVLGRPSSRVHLLWSCAAFMLLLWPSSLFSPGFQLSFVAMSCLLVGGSAGSMQWRLSWGLAGLGLVHFGYISWVGGLLNLVAIPVFSVLVMPFALLAWMLPAPTAEWALACARPGARLLLDLADVGSRVSPWGRQEALVLIVFWLGLRFLRWRWDERGRGGEFGSTRRLRWAPPGVALLGLLWGVVETMPSAEGESWSWESSRRVGREAGWGRVEVRRAGGRLCTVGVMTAKGERPSAVVGESWWSAPSEFRRQVVAEAPGAAMGALSQLPACRRGVPFALSGPSDSFACPASSSGCWSRRAGVSPEP
jgi:ComEC/Rec2-related protein